MTSVYTEGVCEDGAAILCDGQRMTVSQILDALNRIDGLRAALERCCEELEQWHDAKNVLAIARAALKAKP